MNYFFVVLFSVFVVSSATAELDVSTVDLSSLNTAEVAANRLEGPVASISAQELEGFQTQMIDAASEWYEEVLLFNQALGAQGEGITYQDFPDFPDFSNMAADDFIVPEGFIWTINHVLFSQQFSDSELGPGFYDLNYWVYPDANGKPAADGNEVCSGTVLTDYTTFPIILALDKPCVISAGTYWIALQIVMEYTLYGQSYWNGQVNQFNNPAVWREPGDGFGVGCVDWGYVESDCGIGDSPDLTFALYGSNETENGDCSAEQCGTLQATLDEIIVSITTLQNSVNALSDTVAALSTSVGDVEAIVSCNRRLLVTPSGRRCGWEKEGFDGDEDCVACPLP